MNSYHVNYHAPNYVLYECGVVQITAEIEVNNNYDRKKNEFKQKIQKILNVLDTLASRCDAYSHPVNEGHTNLLTATIFLGGNPGKEGQQLMDYAAIFEQAKSIIAGELARARVAFHP